MNNRTFFARSATAGVAALIATSFTLAAPLMSHAAPMKSMKTMHGQTMAHGVYVCTKCHEYYSPSAAKKMGYKDDMGHHLVKVSKIPVGYMNGATTHMSGMSGMKM